MREAVHFVLTVVAAVVTLVMVLWAACAALTLGADGSN